MNTPASTSRHVRVGDVVVKILKVIVPIAISVGLIAWMLHKVDIQKVEAIIRQGVDYRYLLVMMALTSLSQIIRGFRWRLQLRAAGVAPLPALAACVSIFGAYALNLIITFLGEAWRCVYVARRQRCQLSTVVGTDLGDRASDGVMISLFIILTVFVARPAIDRFMDRYPLGEALQRFSDDPTTWVSILVVLAVVGVVLYLLRHTSAVQGMIKSALRMWHGFAVLFTMKGRGLYLLLTLGIWVCYFFMTYTCFFAFPFTRALVEHSHFYGLLPGLVVFVFGSCSMIVPSNGGLGPWNISVMFALSLYGISDADGTAYSIVCWSFQTLMLVIQGVFSAFYIAASRRRKKN
ncbi:MAG: flippase-like domain-containing protein [Muribaculaceae bacterium]|nr:flippase-like domain-containing protein [Muribaculaceae bacterium]